MTKHYLVRPILRILYTLAKLTGRSNGVNVRLLERVRVFEPDAPRICWVYQPGKVASTSIHSSLLDQKLTSVHTHVMSASRQIRTIFDPLGGVTRQQHAANIVYILIKKLLFTAPCSVIVPVRDPVTRLNSVTFHSLANLLGSISRIESLNRAPSITDLFSYFHKQRGTPFSDINQWFTEDFLPTTGIMINNLAGKTLPFTLEHKGKSYLFVRFEDLNHPVTVNALREFTKAPDLKLTKENYSPKKWYAPLMREIKENYKIDENLEKQLRSSLYAKTFGYTTPYTPMPIPEQDGPAIKADNHTTHPESQ